MPPRRKMRSDELTAPAGDSSYSKLRRIVFDNLRASHPDARPERAVIAEMAYMTQVICDQALEAGAVAADQRNSFERANSRVADEAWWDAIDAFTPNPGEPKRRPISEVREILASRPRKCSRTCPGWGVFESIDREPEIEVCDECMIPFGEGKPRHADWLTDYDVDQLPEAKAALAEMVAELEADEREEVERATRVVSGGKVVSRWNPARSRRR